MDNGTREESGEDFEVEVTEVSRSGQVRQSQSLGRGLSPRRRFWRLASAIGVVALVLVVLALDLSGRLNPQQFLPKPPPPLTLRPQTQGMTCLLDAAWSPQSTRIALLGSQYQATCPDFSVARRAGLVTVYEAHSGKLLATLHPDEAVVPAIQTFSQRVAPTGTPPAADTIASAVSYQHVLWSPDGTRLALTFTLDPTYIGLSPLLPDGEPAVLAGVVLLDANGRHPQVVAHLVSAYASSPIEWDLTARTLVLAPTPGYACGTFGCYGPFPPALAYTWQADGTLAADTPLSFDAPPPAPPLAPVGNQDGGRAFTIWQPGFVSGLSLLGLLPELPGIYQWSGTLEAWSPDGRYLLDAIEPGLLLVPPGTPLPTQDELTAHFIFSPWLLPVRDAGLLRVLHTASPHNPAGTAIAWRPDGRALAAYAPENVFAPHPLLIDGCATGRQLAALLPPAAAASAALPGRFILLRWSPDGSHLLLFALALGQVVVWGPQQLPH
jgi:hypothetical protein